MEKENLTLFLNTFQEILEISELSKCSLCSKCFQNPVFIKCRHSFCGICAKKILKKEKNECPICQEPFVSPDLQPDFEKKALSDFIRSVDNSLKKTFNQDVLGGLSKILKKKDSVKQGNIKSTPKKNSRKTINKTNRKRKRSESACSIQNPDTFEKQSTIVKKPRNTRTKMSTNKTIGTVEKTSEQILNQEEKDATDKFINSPKKIEILKWLENTNNVFDRKSQTQTCSANVMSENPSEYDDINSVSQLHKMVYQAQLKLAKNKKKDLTKINQNYRQACSLNVVEARRKTTAKRRTLAADCPDFEENVIKDDQNNDALLHLMEEACLSNLEELFVKPGSPTASTSKANSNLADGSGKKNTSGWNRLKDMNKNITKVKESQNKLKVNKKSSRRKNRELPDDTKMEICGTDLTNSSTGKKLGGKELKGYKTTEKSKGQTQDTKKSTDRPVDLKDIDPTNVSSLVPQDITGVGVANESLESSKELTQDPLIHLPVLVKRKKGLRTGIKPSSRDLNKINKTQDKNLNVNDEASQINEDQNSITDTFSLSKPHPPVALSDIENFFKNHIKEVEIIKSESEGSEMNGKDVLSETKEINKNKPEEPNSENVFDKTGHLKENISTCNQLDNEVSSSNPVNNEEFVESTKEKQISKSPKNDVIPGNDDLFLAPTQSFSSKKVVATESISSKLKSSNILDTLVNSTNSKEETDDDIIFVATQENNIREPVSETKLRYSALENHIKKFAEIFREIQLTADLLKRIDPNMRNIRKYQIKTIEAINPFMEKLTNPEIMFDVMNEMEIDTADKVIDTQKMEIDTENKVIDTQNQLESESADDKNIDGEPTYKSMNPPIECNKVDKTEERNKDIYELSASFDELEFETQDIIKGCFNEKLPAPPKTDITTTNVQEYTVTQILDNLQEQNSESILMSPWKNRASNKRFKPSNTTVNTSKISNLESQYQLQPPDSTKINNEQTNISKINLLESQNQIKPTSSSEINNGKTNICKISHLESQNQLKPPGSSKINKGETNEIFDSKNVSKNSNNNTSEYNYTTNSPAIKDTIPQSYLNDILDKIESKENKIVENNLKRSSGIFMKPDIPDSKNNDAQNISPLIRLIEDNSVENDNFIKDLQLTTSFNEERFIKNTTNFETDVQSLVKTVVNAANKSGNSSNTTSNKVSETNKTTQSSDIVISLTGDKNKGVFRKLEFSENIGLVKVPDLQCAKTEQPPKSRMVDISVCFETQTPEENLNEVSLGSSDFDMEYVDEVWEKIKKGSLGKPKSKRNMLQEINCNPKTTQKTVKNCDNLLKNVTNFYSDDDDDSIPAYQQVKNTKPHNEKVSEKENVLTSVKSSDSNMIKMLLDEDVLESMNQPFTCNQTESKSRPQDPSEIPNKSTYENYIEDFNLDDENDREMELIRTNDILGEQRIMNQSQNKPISSQKISCSDDFFSDHDIIESSPENTPKKSKSLDKENEIFLNCLSETFTPPPEFQDSPDNEPDKEATVVPDECDTTTISENYLDCTVVTKVNETRSESSENLFFSPISKVVSQRTLTIGTPNCSFKNKRSSTPRTQKQVSIKNFMIKQATNKEVGESLFKPFNDDKKPCIACTRLSREQIVAISALTNKKLATYNAVFDQSVTHMIVNVDENNSINDHTIKFISAVAAGIWVLNFKWIQKCLAENKIVPEAPYEVLDLSGNPGPKESRLYGKIKPLLSGFKIHVALPLISATQADIENIVKMLGGSVASTPEELLNNDDFVCIIITESSSTQDFNRYEGWLNQLEVITVDIEWLSYSVSQYKLQSLWKFALCSTDNLDSLRYPNELIEAVPFTFLPSEN